jgi:hypothetical protein
MAPIKFEDNIREKLEGREIEPSKNAWNKLSDQLDASSDRKTTKVIWYAIAASLIGILIAVSVFNTRNNKSVENATDFVKTDTSESEVKSTDESGSGINASEENSTKVIAAQEVNAVLNNMQEASGIEKILPKKKEMTVEKKKQMNSEAIAKISEQALSEKISQLPEEVITKEDLIMKKRINELVAQVEIFQHNKESVSVDEIDALMAKAEIAVQRQKVLQAPNIDPAALLGDVELELDNSFRHKIFTTLGDGFNMIKTAVVNRNN